MAMAFDAGAYAMRRQGIEGDYAAQRAANEYARSVSQQRGQRTLGYMREDYNRRLPGFSSGYGRRGLAGAGVQSGVYQRALQNYATDQFRQVQGVQDQMQDDWNQYDQSNRDLESRKQSALAELEWRRRMEIMQSAAALQRVQ